MCSIQSISRGLCKAPHHCLPSQPFVLTQQVPKSGSLLFKMSIKPRDCHLTVFPWLLSANDVTATLLSCLGPTFPSHHFHLLTDRQSRDKRLLGDSITCGDLTQNAEQQDPDLREKARFRVASTQNLTLIRTYYMKKI